jgi:outer membrane protein assembly factor BamB
MMLLMNRTKPISAAGITIAVALAIGSTALVAENWPSWRGPTNTGVSTETDLPVSWSSKENVLWKLPLPGVSGSTPIVWDDRVFLTVADGGNLELWSVERTQGTVLWKRHLDTGNEKKRKGNLSSPSPVTDGKRVWALTGTGTLRAFDFGGRELWSRNLQNEYGRFGILHGYSSSPLLHGSSLYIQVLHGFHTDDPSYLLALDTKSGQTRWRVERPTDAPREAPDAYTTPALLESADGIVIVVSGADYVTGHAAESGEELWRIPGLNPTRNPMQRIVASPVVRMNLIYVPSRVKPFLAMQASGLSGRIAPDVTWKTDRGPDVPSPVVTESSVYLLNDSGILWQLEAATGNVIWGPKRLETSSYSASPVLADGRLYATNENGLTTVVSAGAEFNILAINDVGENTLASLAISEGQIFLRTARHLFCIGETK